jgi:phage-related holin
MEQTSKIKAIISLIFAPLITFFAPVSAVVVPLLWLVVLDVTTGIYASRVIEKNPITSRGFFRKFPQVLMLFIAIAGAIHADPFFVQVGIEPFQSAKLVTSFYGLYELFSILENLGRSGLPVAKQFANLLQAKLPEEMKKNIEAQQKEDAKI